MAPRKKAKVEEALQETTSEVREDISTTDTLPEVVEIIESTTPSKEKLKVYIRTRIDFQRMRIRMSNRMGVKADGEEMELDCQREVVESKEFKSLMESTKKLENECEAMMLKELKKFPFFCEYFGKKDEFGRKIEETKGVGTIISAAIMAYIDIEKADTVSKIWQYAGLNPGMVHGKKSTKVGDDIVIEPQEDLVRGDRLTSGFVSPYNKSLKTVLMGLAAGSFIKAKGKYAELYYSRHIPEKYRTDEKEMKKRPDLAGRYGIYDHSEKLTREIVAGGKFKVIPWKKTSEVHKDMAAKRYMIKMFLLDVYVAWRTFEGLPVRAPYNEEYLGHVSSQKAV